MPIMPFMIMTEAQAAAFREETAGDGNRLDPRKIDAGTHAGKYALPERVKFDPAFEERRDAFRMLTVATLDTVAAWPPVEEPDE
jgi:hypothetical protein